VKLTDESMPRRRAIRAIVAVVVPVMMLTACTAADPEPTTAPVRGELTLSIGSLLPLTGSLASVGPATTAAAALAVDDINAAAAGITVTLTPEDAGDATADTGSKSVKDLIAAGVSAIVGPVSNGVSKMVIDQITSAAILQISPGNTSPDFTNYADHGLYWRTSPSCVLEGTAMGNFIAQQGVASLGIIDQTGYCGAGLGDAVKVAFEAAGGTVASSATLDESDPNVSAKIAPVIAAKPAAFIVIGSQAASVVPVLTAAKVRGDQLYFSGLSIGDHSGDFAAGSLTGAVASRPGPDLSALTDFAKRLQKKDPAVTDIRYAAETYDAVVLVALAALAANDTSGVAIAGKLQEVSGGSGDGTKTTDFATAAGIIRDGGIVNYDGISGPITFDENGDPAGAIIGFYRFGANNTSSSVRL
jgi:branched-chain amino acid transport system substrate-binding protein